MIRITAFVLALRMILCALFGGFGIKQSVDIRNSDFAAAGYSLSCTMQKQCYNAFRHTLNHKTDAKGMPYVWPAASFVEMLADTYRLFPGDPVLKRNYRDALKNLFPKYLAKDRTIRTPSGEVTGISYYNSYAGGADSYYYDDNEWVCIQLLLGYRNLGDPALLAAAEENLAFLQTGWDDAAGGGIYWYMDYQTKNACSNAPGAIAFLLAYQLTGKTCYLERGMQIYDWMNETMRENDLFIDNVAADGTVQNRWKGTYNQATMIYAGCLLYEITGDARYYALTRATADATIAHLFDRTQNTAGEAVISMKANPIFKAWCVGWLARAYVKYYEIDPRKDETPMAYLTAVLSAELQTSDGDGLYDPFFCSGASDPENYTDLLSQCGVACTFLNAAYFDAVLHPAATTQAR